MHWEYLTRIYIIYWIFENIWLWKIFDFEKRVFKHVFVAEILKLDHLRCVVLDEADTLLDDSFSQKLTYVLKKFPVSTKFYFSEYDLFLYSILFTWSDIKMNCLCVSVLFIILISQLCSYQFFFFCYDSINFQHNIKVI